MTRMTPERWQKIKRLFDLALDHEPDRRSAFLAEACPDDEELRREVESMLAGVTSGAGILDGPVWGKMGVSPDSGPPEGNRLERSIPETIGHYRVLRLLGEGGMGTVYEAEQDQPRRIVALKVIKPGWASPELLRRFQLESQALGRLHHPGIAQIYEAGTADAGFGPQPYFAMEFIHGETLRDYAEMHHLDARQRLELVAKVCDAVDHAHQRFIIHRDLKPGNILVEEGDQPKILDFGMARVTDSDAHATRQTDMGQLVGTLAYMSPEQVLADPMELDTRSDVYALGVILFELLAKRLPYQLSHRLDQAVRTIREEDPTRLSSISRAYRGDVETIVGKALEKDKTRRYSSAAALAGDIRRYLGNEPITARPASAGYQLQKFARRHKTLVAAAAAVFVVLLAGIVASTWEAVQARRAEQTAVTAEQETRAVNDFLQNDVLGQASTLAQAGPGAKPDLELTVRTALDRAASNIEGKFPKQPLVEASIRHTMGRTYFELGLYSEAQHQLERGLLLRRGILGPGHAETLSVANDLGETYAYQNRYEQAEVMFAKILQNRRSALGEQHPDTLLTMNDLAVVYEFRGKYKQAGEMLAHVLDAHRRVLGEEHPHTLYTLANLAMNYSYERRYSEAEALLMKALETDPRVLGNDHPFTISALADLALVYQWEGRYAQAEEIFSKVLDSRRRVLGEDAPSTLDALVFLGHVRLKRKKYGSAERALRTALSLYEGKGGHNWEQYNCRSLIGASFAAQKRYAEAEPLLLSGYEGMKERKETISATKLYFFGEAQNAVVQLYRDWGKPERAAEWSRRR